MHAVLEQERDRGPHGQPMSEALDSDTALDNPDAPYVYEPYYFRDNAAAAIRIAQDRLRDASGSDDALADLQWGVVKKPKPPPIRY